jgi:hypothetical protein
MKTFFDWIIRGGATIIQRSPRTTRNEKKFQDRPKNFFKKIIYDPLYRTNGVIFFIDYCTAVRDT